MFQHEIEAEVVIEASGEAGMVIGRAEYYSMENSYLVRYKSADGRAVEQWWVESALVSVK